MEGITVMTLTRTDAPLLDVQLFSDASLTNPYPDYRRLRDLGPVVQLPHPQVYAIGRFNDVQAALRAPDKLINGEGIGFSDAFNVRRGSNVIQSDGDFHARMRATVMRPLAPNRIREARADLKAMMRTRADALIGCGWFDAMKELASFLPVQAIAHLVGLPDVGRERMLEWAAATFNLIGPDSNPTDLASVGELREFMAGLSEETVASGSWAAWLFEAARIGKLAPQEAMGALSAYIIPSLDTTILAKGHLLNDLAQSPDQWALLKERPELISSAVSESVRRNSVLRWFARVAVEDYEIEDFAVPKGARVMLLYGCANRDERRYEDPDRFDITRDARDQLAWGTGAHMCAGMHLARLEMEVLLEALVEVDAHLEVGASVMGTNRGLFGYAELPMRLETAH
jgi:cytochrome P450